MLRARPQRLETPSDDDGGSTSGASDDVPVYRASGLSLGMSSTNSWRKRMNTKDALLSPGPVALGKRRRPQDQGLEVRNSYETQVSRASHASHASVASEKSSASQELTPEQRELAREVQKNRERLAADLRAGLAELLELHNTEELRTLCKTLEIGRLGSKKSNFAAVLALLTDGAEEAGCRRVLDGVWDGIIIEYLRSLGKNLMKCKDDIRGAALQHWKRNTAAVIGARAAGSQGLAAPVFIKGSVWRRTNATSDTDVKVRRFLRRLEATEGDLKALEKGVRARPDFEMVTKFLAQIHVVRDLEEIFRDELLNMLQDLLGERDVMLESAKRAVAEANEARARAREIEKHDVSRSFFVGLADVMHQQRILESIRIQVEITQRERDIEALHDKIARMIRTHVLQEGELRLRIEELETDLADTSETLRLRSECLADTERKLLERDEELAALRADFDAFRVGAETLVAESLARSSQAEADALQASEFAKRERSRAKKLEGELEDALRKVAEANQQRECVEMEAADREALEVRADEALRLALQLEEEEKALSAEELAKASAEKGKGKSKGKGKGSGKGKSGKGGKASPAGKKGGKSSPTAGKKDGKASPKSPAKKSGKKSPAGAKKAKKR